MEHTIFVQGNQQAIITEHDRFHFEVTALVDDIPNVAYDTTTYQDAERWAKAVIAYAA